MKIGKSRFCFITLKIYYSIETVHEGKKPFKCNICDAGFVSEADLNRLNASVHEGRKVQCDFCVSSFTKENNFQCSICDTRD